MKKIVLAAVVLATLSFAAQAQVSAAQKEDILREDQRRVDAAKALIKADTDAFRAHRKTNDVAAIEADRARVLSNINAYKAALYRLEENQKLLVTK
jgi:hypothetical protein